MVLLLSSSASAQQLYFNCHIFHNYRRHKLHSEPFITLPIKQLIGGIYKIPRQHLRRGTHKVFDIGTMVVHHNVKGYEEFTKMVEELEGSGQPIHVLFSGGKNENGESWCPYCVKAEPIIHDALSKAAEKSHFVHVDVGERSYWKDLNCPFRKDPNTHLVFLPTLLRWKSPQRLDGERCSNKELVEMMFEDED